MHVHPSTLTGILKRLERQGLVERRADPRDGRRALFGVPKLQHTREVLDVLAKSVSAKAPLPGLAMERGRWPPEHSTLRVGGYHPPALRPRSPAATPSSQHDPPSRS